MTDTDIQEVKELISKGANINAKDDYNRTALMYAASKGRKDIVKLLKRHGAKE